MKSLLAFFLLFPLTATAGPIAPLSPLLEHRYATLTGDEQCIVIIRLADRGTSAHAPTMDEAPQLVSQRSIARRLKVRTPDRVVEESDLPLERSYVDAIAQNVTAVRHELKWFNAVTALATKSQIDALRRLPFVSSIDLVNSWKRKHDEPVEPVKASAVVPSGTTSLNYGPSFTQVNIMDAVAVHDFGIYGQGLVIGVFDNGFRLLSHQAFDSMNIIAQYDFVDHKVSVIPNNTNTAFGSHGVTTLSTIGGYFPGQLIGPAFKASYVLARTENDSSETPIEEDNWAAAIQWADSIGIDVSSTSLGYLGFDPPYDTVSLTADSMNGTSALITRAADHAVTLGIIVVNSAGNEGPGDGVHNTLIAPADGFDVITAGAVTSTGTRASFSSVGPTADAPPRIKPDIMAMGQGVYVASPTNPTAYGGASGTSYSCPLSAGAAALVLCANPSLTPAQVRDALRNTANNHASPNNQYGWGIIDALAAIRYNGATANAAMHGTIFNDINGNGVRDAGEPALQNSPVYLSGFAAETTQTDINGAYAFGPLQFGDYTVREGVPAGWVATGASADSLPVKLLFGMDTSGLNLGLFHLGSIAVTVAYDSNKNATLDAGDSPLLNRRVHLSGPVTADTSTDAAGHAFFAGLPAGSYTVSESAYVNTIQTFPPANGNHTVAVYSGLDTAGLLFLNYFDSIFNYHVVAGWNLLSLPQDSSTHLKTDLYPSAVSRAFVYDHVYTPIDTIPNGVGYWVKFATGQNFLINGAMRLADTINVKQGWNMIGSLSQPVTVASLVGIPPGLITSGYFSYDGTYHVADTLFPHAGYWVKASAPCQIAMSASSNTPSASPVSGAADAAATFGKLTITDAAGHAGTLSFSDDASVELDRFALPPTPPEAAFDIRYATGNSLALVRAGRETGVVVASAVYPLKVAWEENGAAGARLTVDGRAVALAGKGSTTIARPAELKVGGAKAAPPALPTAFALGQNFPNPFNPATEIGIDLPHDAYVTLKVFNLLGQEITTLVDGPKAAGRLSVKFDASALPAGIYFYRVQAGGFSAVRKMVLAK